MNRLALASIFFISSCSSDPIQPIKPDPSGGSSASSSSASSGAGGAGGGLSCDPCENKDGLRIQSRRLVSSSADGFYRVDSSGYFDSKLGVPCQALIADDGVRRCVPYTGGIVSYYSDSACSLIVLGSLACTKLGVSDSLGVAGQGQCAQQTYQVWNIGAEYLGPVYSNSSGACSDVSALRPLFKFNLTSGKIQASEFAEMKIETLP